MGDFATGAVLYKIALLALIIPAYLLLRQNPRREVKNALVWAIILAILVVGWSLFH